MILPLFLFAQQVALGADTPVLAAGFAAVAILCAIALYLLAEPDARFWNEALPLLALCIATATWLVLPLMAPARVPARAAALVAPDLASLGLAQWFAGITLLFAAAWLGHRRGALRLVIDNLLVLALVQIAIALLLRQIDPEHVWGQDKGILTHRFTGTFSNANASGCLFGTVAILGLGRLLSLLRERTTIVDDAAHHRRMVVAMLAVAAGVGACAITESRMAWTMTMVTLASLAGSDRMIHRLLRRPLMLIPAGAAALAVGCIALWFGATTIGRYGSAGSDAVGRFTIWRHYWTMASEQLAGGYGFYALDELALRSVATPQVARELLYVHSPHNWLLSLLLVGGWPYAAAALAGVAIIIRALTRGTRRSTQDPLLRAVVAALLFTAACATIDVALDVPAVLSLALVLLGLAWGRALRLGSPRQEASR